MAQITRASRQKQRISWGKRWPDALNNYAQAFVQSDLQGTWRKVWWQVDSIQSTRRPTPLPETLTFDGNRYTSVCRFGRETGTFETRVLDGRRVILILDGNGKERYRVAYE